MNKVFKTRFVDCSNLTWNTSWQTLKDHFKTVGTGTFPKGKFAPSPGSTSSVLFSPLPPCHAVVYADVLRDGSKSKVFFPTVNHA